MKVGSKRGAGIGANTGGQDRSQDERRQMFRSRHSPGQEVEGEVRRELEEGIAWVDVGGLELSARVPFKAKPGQRLLLRIESLAPEIVLKFIKQLHVSAGTVQVQAYTAMRNHCDMAWREFLHSLCVPAETNRAGADISPEAAIVPKTGEPLPAGLIAVGEQETTDLHQLFYRRFVPFQAEEAGVELAKISKIQSSHLSLLRERAQNSTVRAWTHVPWAGLNGAEKELLLCQERGQKLETLLLSGVWPRLGAAFITALCLDGEISCRISAQTAIPFEEAALLLNLGGLGAVLRLTKEMFGLDPWPATRSLTCLEYKERPADSVAAILLRLQVKVF